MKHYLHVNQHIIKSNSKKGESEPVLTCKSYKKNTYANRITLKNKSGEEILKVVYSPDKPLSCGAKVYIEFDDNHVEVEYE
jgi:hypothetical protein